MLYFQMWSVMFRSWLWRRGYAQKLRDVAFVRYCDHRPGGNTLARLYRAVR